MWWTSGEMVESEAIGRVGRSGSWECDFIQDTSYIVYLYVCIGGGVG